MAMSAIRQAATVVLLRQGKGGLETLMLRRNAAVLFAGGLWVFPGGRIDIEDFAGDPTDVLAAAKRAAVRETREEAGLDIEGHELHYFAHWTTPTREVKRYATWFFATLIDTADSVEVDGQEIEEHQWMTPAAAVAAHRAQQLDMLPPTVIALLELETCRTIDDVWDMYRDRQVEEITPKFFPQAGQPCTLYPGDAGYEAGDPDIPGARHRSVRKVDGWYYLREV
jgi:8-oxo-dGTP pyrophosphatase MutT (NUDIX family)